MQTKMKVAEPKSTAHTKIGLLSCRSQEESSEPLTSHGQNQPRFTLGVVNSSSTAVRVISPSSREDKEEQVLPWLRKVSVSCDNRVPDRTHKGEHK